MAPLSTPSLLTDLRGSSKPTSRPARLPAKPFRQGRLLLHSYTTTSREGECHDVLFLLYSAAFSYQLLFLFVRWDQAWRVYLEILIESITKFVSSPEPFKKSWIQFQRFLAWTFVTIRLLVIMYCLSTNFRGEGLIKRSLFFIIFQIWFALCTRKVSFASSFVLFYWYILISFVWHLEI